MLLYERYHKSIKLQKRVIDERNFTYRFLISVINKYLKSSKNVLDIGCGTGTVDFYVAKKGKNTVGLDVSRRAIYSAKQNARNLHLERRTEFIVSRFPKINFDKKFDLIICSEVLEHLPNALKAVTKINNLLQKDGVVVFSTPSKNSIIFRMGFARRFDKNVGHLRRYDVKSLTKVINKAGLKIIDIKKEQGFIRDFLFISPLGKHVVRAANRFGFLSDFLTFVDHLFLPLGESDILVTVKK